MNADSKERVEELFHRLREMPASARGGVLDAELADDPAARAELEEFLRHYDDGTPQAFAVARELQGVASRFPAGFTLGDFRIEGVLGEGGGGVVYEATQTSLGRRVALKLLPAGFASSARARERFQREAETGARLTHPGIVAVYEVGEHEGVHAIAQELVPGGRSFADLLWDWREQPRPDRKAYEGIAQLFIGIAEALHHAHEQGVVHRDVKPSNVLLTPEGAPKVADFGIAKVVHEAALSKTGEFAGTPFYASPEQASGSGAAVDARSDVFSLGVCLYEALTATRPFDGDTSEQVLLRIARHEPPEPIRIRSRVPWELSAICMKALEKAPGRRYASMAALARDLEGFLSHTAIVARRPGPSTRAIKWTRRHPAITSALAASAAGLTLAGFAWWNAIQERDLAIWRESIANVRGAAILLAGGSTLDARALLDSVPEEHRHWEWQHLLLQADYPLRTFGDQSVRHLRLSADGTLFGAESRDGGFRAWRTDTGELATEWRAPTASGVLLDWSLDAAVAVYKSDDDTLVIRDLASGAVLRERVLEKPIGEARISADGRCVLSRNDQGATRLWRAESGEGVVDLELEDIAHALALSADGSVAVAFRSPSLVVWRAGAGLERFEVQGNRRHGTQLALSPDLEHLAMTIAAREAAVLDLRSGSWVSLPKPDTLITSLAWSAEGDSVLIGTDTGHVERRNRRNGSLLERRKITDVGIYDLIVDELADELHCGFVGRPPSSWSLRRSEPEFVVPTRERVRDAVFRSDSQRLYLGLHDGSIDVLDLETGAVAARSGAERGRTSALAISGDDRFLAQGFAARIEIREAESLRTLEEIHPLPPVWGLDFDATGGWLAAALDDRSVRIWNTKTWEIEAQRSELAGKASCVDFHPSRPVLAFATNGGDVQLWEFRSGKPPSVLLAAPDEPEVTRAVNFSDDGRWLSAGFGKGRVVVWDARTGEEVVTFPHRPEQVEHADLAPDASRLVVVGRSGSLRLWDLTRPEEHELVASFQRPGRQFDFVQFSPDGERLIAAGPGRTLHLWESDAARVRAILATLGAASAQPSAPR